MLRTRYKYFLWFLIGLAVLLSIYAGWQRHLQEQQNRQVELLVEYGQVLKLAEFSGKQIPEIFKDLQKNGATGVLFKEETLKDLEMRGKVFRKNGLELLAEPQYRAFTEEIQEDYTYIVTRNVNLARQIAFHLNSKLWEDTKVQTLQVLGWQLVGVPLSIEVLETIGLGFPEEGLHQAKRAGMKAALQVRTWPGAQVETIEAVMDSLKRFDNLSLVLFNDHNLPGSTDPVKIAALARKILELDVPVAAIEFHPQQGLENLGRALEKKVVRLHSITETEMEAITPQAVLDRLELAVRERNIRVVLVRFFLKGVDGHDLLVKNQTYLKKLAATLHAKGFEQGSAQPFGTIPLPYPRLYLFFIGTGVLAAGVLLLKKKDAEYAGWILGALALIIWTGLLATGQVIWGRKLMALAAAVIFPTWAVILHLRNEGVTPTKSIGLLLSTCLVTFVGALMIVGLLADVAMMVNLDQFAGVKVSFVLPLLLIIFFTLAWDYRGQWKKLISDFLSKKVTVGYVLGAVLAVIILYAYLSRTGNAGIPVAELELKARHFLNDVLLVRPRTKEFFIGHPLLILSFYLGYSKKHLLLVLLGAVGQLSLLNTFTHIHIPLAISMLRTVHGFWMGAVLGVVLIGLHLLWVRKGRRVVDE